VKQEIAKEGILPLAKFFGQSKNLSFGRFLSRIQRKDKSFAHRHLSWLLKQKWMDAREHNQEAPFGALCLHWTFTVVMILATISLTPTDAYNLLVSLYSYTIVAVFGCLLGFGILKLRFSRRKWQKKSNANPFLSILAGFVFLIGSAYPVIASWVPPTGSFKKARVVPWFTTPVVGFCILGFGVIWYLGFNLYAMREKRKSGLVFHVQIEPHFVKDAVDGLPVQVHETVYHKWSAKEANDSPGEAESRSSLESF
jgi:hypothetical protein